MVSSSSLPTIKSLSYFRTGGTCQGIITPKNVSEIQAVLTKTNQENTAVFFLGGGSNSLISDDFFPGYVLSSSHLSHISFTPPDLIQCGAGVMNSDLADFASEHNLLGAAWLNGLPGHIGGTTRMNARCYGSEIAHIIHRIATVSSSDSEKKIYNEAPKLFYGYKDTYFMHAHEFIYEVTFKLIPATNEQDMIKERKLKEFCHQDRIAKGQYLHPSCGCVFKNNYDIGVPSGILLELAGLKGLSQGGATVSEFHANFIQNTGSSTQDILHLSFAMRDKVYQMFGVWLEYEMEFLGHFNQATLAIIQQKKPQITTKACQDALTQARNIFHQKQQKNC
ncbi:MAG: UDP-N-acetylmuramate dehydrogenase [Proteobacteria bacterium]|nr:UDP-N-acetylmuramate dehydrogenase [Pseudomonadota bacterium]